jgi:peptidoglycan-N-acetylglucosamine deacetylase
VARTGGRPTRGLGVLAASLAAALLVVVPGAAGPGMARAADPVATAPAPSPAAPAPGPAQPVPSPAAPAPRVVWRGPAGDRVVALTFDDGWNPATLRAIYRILVRENVAATFFVTGVYVQRDPDLWRAVAARFPVANHSYLHRDTRRLTQRQVAVDLARTRTVVEAATGRRMLPYFRPPYGWRTPRTDQLAAAAGFPTMVLWDVTAADTNRRPSTARVVRAATAGRQGSIVLLHAGPRVTVRALPAIIARYRERGFRFVTVPELLGDPWSPGGTGTVAPRSLDRVDDQPPGGPSSGDERATAGGDVEPLVAAPPPARPAPSAAPAPPARGAAWARSAGTPWALAVGTGAVLLGLLALAALAGRAGRREDETSA